MSRDSWIEISYGQTGSGSGTFGFSVEKSNVGQVRTGSILAAGVTFTVIQAAANCSYTLTPSGASIPSEGGAGSFRVATSCVWSATAADSWIHVSSSGDTVSFTVDPNTDSATRNGSIAVANQTFRITQAGRSCVTSLTPPEAAVVAAGVAGSISVSAPGGCSWTAASNATWVTITAGASGNGSGTVNYSVTANAATTARSTTISIGGKVFALRQEARTCTYSLSPATVTVVAGGGQGRFSVTAPSGCSWTATPDAIWITARADATGVDYSVAANTSATARTGIIAIADQKFTITQSGATTRPAPVLTSVASAASYARDAVAPGEIVALFGSGMGPAELTSLELTPDGQSVSSYLAGTRVFFDGIAASLVYSWRQQVSAVVPYGVDGKSATQVVVEYQNEKSNPISIRVAPAVPGILTADASGTGPAAALNSDYTLNTAANPARRGSFVTLFATGEGQTNPRGQDGRISRGDLPKPVLPVSVQIGGVDAKLYYAGAAPELISGVLQVSAEIPEAVTPGSNVSVILKVGGAESPAGVTIAVAP